jgi:hypothetical protein
MHVLNFILFDNWFYHPYAGKGYQAWSGDISDLGEITLIGLAIGALGALLRHLSRVRAATSCHEPDCKKVAVHHFHDHETGEVYRVCGLHHPARHERGPGHPLHRLHLQYHSARTLPSGSGAGLSATSAGSSVPEGESRQGARPTR